MALQRRRIASPVGRLTLIGQGDWLAAVLWPVERPGRVRFQEEPQDVDAPVLLETERQLGEYFSGRRRLFDLPLKPQGTVFQQEVWSALLAIPYAETRTYAQLARDLGRPSASRAVGAANGRNPISIVTPCHRVVGASGDLTGFAGGLAAKAWLLGLERSADQGRS